ncbi:MAG: hypothetical protein QM490_02385 [Candidatus Gracilibacteria bacterium]
MKKILSILLLMFLNMPNGLAYEEIYGELNSFEKQVLTFGNNTCEGIVDSDIPTIFIPGVLASWYSEEGFDDSKIKRWIPDPITHSYDTLFYTFKENGYDIKDVFYKDEFNTYIVGNPNNSLYLFGYDWKKDNKVTAKLLSNLILQIREKYEEKNGCDIGTVNIVAHSMGGLVARAMLQDMCASDEAIINFYNRNGLQEGELKDFISTKCNYTMINKLITISTPHRGSPSSFPIWEKGDLWLTDTFVKSELIERQLGSSIVKNLYKIIHGFDSNFPNGIVTLGQLLPDIKKSNNYNNNLVYLEKDGKKISKDNHTQNSFLEELNIGKNIDKMFSNISGNYVSYYSTLTGNKDKNNIIGFSIGSDQTEYYFGKDIYSTYDSSINKKIYNIDENIRNEEGLGGDGTVPTNNLRLVPNDSYSGKEIKNNKFKPIEMKCYDGEIGNDIERETNLYENFGETNMEICSHTKTPVGLSIKIIKEISGNIIVDDIEQEKKLLSEYIGYLDYIFDNITYSYKDSIVGEIEIIKKIETGILNFMKIGDLFEDKYNHVSLNNDGYINLNFGGKIGQWTSLLRYEILSPINIIIEDELGRKIGIDPDTGMIINEIPGAWTSGNTEGSNEPEFFLIPRSGTGQILHKIYTYGTGDGEYHIVMNEIKSKESETGKEVSLVIAGVAKKGEEEGYIVGIKGNKAGYSKIDSNMLDILNESVLEKKYKDILEKLIYILDTKYKQKARNILKEKLIKFQSLKSNKFKDNEKVNYLIRKLIEYLGK